MVGTFEFKCHVCSFHAHDMPNTVKPLLDASHGLAHTKGMRARQSVVALEYQQQLLFMSSGVAIEFKAAWSAIQQALFFVLLAQDVSFPLFGSTPGGSLLY